MYLGVFLLYDENNHVLWRLSYTRFWIEAFEIRYDWTTGKIQNHSSDKKKWFINLLRSRQNGRHYPDDIFKCIFFNENSRISIRISLKFVPKGLFNNIPALVQVMAWHGSEPLLISLLMHICITRPLWVKNIIHFWKQWWFPLHHVVMKCGWSRLINLSHEDVPHGGGLTQDPSLTKVFMLLLHAYLANGSTAFKWKLCCHWLKRLATALCCHNEIILLISFTHSVSVLFCYDFAKILMTPFYFIDDTYRIECHHVTNKMRVVVSFLRKIRLDMKKKCCQWQSESLLQ